MPQQRNIAATLALLLMTSGAATPAAAAPNHDILCDEHHEATLDVSAEELATRPVSHDLAAQKNPQDTETVSASQVLKPRFDATVREVFAEDEKSATEAEAKAEPEVEEPSALRIRVPGISDEELVRFKRQMYRRDI